MSDDFLRKLLASFKAESQDHLGNIRGILDALAASGKVSGPALEEAFRRAHSLKGAARAVDLQPVESLAHCVETIFARVREGLLPLDRRALKALRLALDSIEDWLGAYFQKKPPPEPVEALDAVGALLGEGAGPGPAREATPPAEPSGYAPLEDDAVRVGARAIERILESSDRVLVESRRQDSVAGRLASVEALARELDSERERLRRSLGRPVEGAPLPAPVSRYLDSVDRRVRALRKDLRELRRSHARGALGLRAAGERLRDETLLARMVPAESVLQGLRKLVRDLARDEGKEIELAEEGLRLKADRLVLQALKDPLMHLLRNSVYHGIEAPAERREAGKAPAGEIRLRLETAGRRLTITVSDDGRGVDWRAVAERAVERRLLSTDEAASATPEELRRLLFLPGFTTSRLVTDLAGRGMGLSVVLEAVKRLQGRVTPRSEGGRGASFELDVPIAVSTHRLAVLESRGQAFALPLAATLRLLQVPVETIETVEGRPAVAVSGRPVPVFALGALLGQGDDALRHEGGKLPVAVLKSGAAIAVDAFLEETESVVLPLRGGAQAAGAFSGAILDGGGRPVLVLDPAELLARMKGAKPGAIVRAEKEPGPKRAPTILVVDDSVTTRTLEKGILEAHGYRVALAVDGEEALRTLRVESVDLAVVDLQMPRMDGFQLIERMKDDPKLSSLPVVIVSSLESRQEKERGLALGADAYILKRKFDHKGLLEAIRQLLR